MLLAPLRQRLHPGVLQLLLDRVEHFAYDLPAIAAGRLHRLGEHPVAVGVEVLQREVLELLADAVQPEAIGDRSVDFECLARNAALLFGAHRLERAHVVQPVGELDQDDAHIARHRQQHLAEVLGLGFGVRLEFDLVELGYAVHQLGHWFSEVARDLGLGDRGVLHHVMQERGGERLRIEVPLGEDVRDRERVRDVGLARLAELPFVRLLAEVIRRLQLRDVLRLEVTGPLLEFGRGGGGH
jgi:hypothetical protein